jgi:zinc protease
VVIEEFKQRYLNQPYGDVWLKLRPLAYATHPYKWATIGKDISHIENATMDDVKDFFFHHYLPNNATLVVGGNVTLEQVKALSEKWFGDIPAGKVKERSFPKEPIQTEKRVIETTADVPLDAIYKTFHIPGRYEENYTEADLVSDILGRSKSSRLHQKLVKEQKLFNNISAYVTGSLDPGLLVISGNLNKGVNMDEADTAITKVLAEVAKERLSEEELEKVKNQAYSTIAFGEVDLLNRVMNLAFAANAGDINYANLDVEKIKAVSSESLHRVAQKILNEANSSTLKYFSKN